MIKPRESYMKSGFSVFFPTDKGQSVIEYVVIFAIVAALSIGLFYTVPGFFSTYVSNATGAMQ